MQSILSRTVPLVVLAMFASSWIPVSIAAGVQEEQGEPQPGPEQNLETRVFEIQNMGGSELDRILRNVFGLGSYTFDSRTRTLVVRAPADLMPAIGQVLERFDVPQPSPRSVEITTHILLASTSGPAGEIPDDLGPVIDQLENVLPGTRFRLIDTVSARAVDAEGFSVDGMLRLFSDGPDSSASYNLRGTPRFGTDSEGRSAVRIDEMLFQTSNARIGTSIDLVEGQQVVVGRTSLAGRGALILVMSAREIR